MAYPLQSMLKIRTMREDRAATALVKARRARQEAERVRDEKIVALSRYEETKDARRDGVFATVIGHVVKMDMLDGVRDAVRVIDEEGILLAEDKRVAEEKVAECTRAAKSAQVRYVAAEKEKEKIALHREAWLAEDSLAQERLADAEMEEFTGKRMEDNADA